MKTRHDLSLHVLLHSINWLNVSHVHLGGWFAPKFTKNIPSSCISSVSIHAESCRFIWDICLHNGNEYNFICGALKNSVPTLLYRNSVHITLDNRPFWGQVIGTTFYTRNSPYENCWFFFKKMPSFDSVRIKIIKLILSWWYQSFFKNPMMDRSKLRQIKPIPSVCPDTIWSRWTNPLNTPHESLITTSSPEGSILPRTTDRVDVWLEIPVSGYRICYFTHTQRHTKASVFLREIYSWSHLLTSTFC